MNILYYVDYQRDRDTCMKIICLEQSEEHEIILYIRSLLGGGGGWGWNQGLLGVLVANIF